ncbi:tetratricopeptide repeat protein [Coleofasciculus chthonoplastes]|uniref:tetratricopeptide repeat protein n=1 Tax=Coleofasciculus chthonoplastes TaxID=64178 RepID=UPI0032F2407B
MNKLAAALDSWELREALQDNREELKFRLRRLFRLLEEDAAKPFLLVLDDFEVNLESCNGGYVLQPEAAEVLESLVWAIQDNYAPHRLIITCRYDFESSQLQSFYKQKMDSLRGADWQKKCNRLTAFGSESQVEEALQAQAQRLADGNPRLLEWLDKVLLNLESPQLALKRGEKNTVAEILARLEADPVELREKVLAKELLKQIDQPMREMLSRGLVFELPVPREAFIAVCRGGFRDKLTGNTDNSEAKPALNNVDEYINLAIALGLLEVSPDESLRVPRILPLKLPEEAETLHRQAAEVLYRLWWENAEEISEKQGEEIHRLALEGKAKNMALEITINLVISANSHSLYLKARQLCELTLENTETEDYHLLHQRAIAEQHSGEIKKAEEYYQQALKNCPQEDKEQRAEIIFHFATLKTDQEDFEEAIKLYDQCLVTFENMGNTIGQAGALNNLGIIKAKLGHIEEGISLLERSIPIFESIDHNRGKVGALNCLGTLKIAQGKVEEAILDYQESIELDDRVESKAVTLSTLGIIQSSKGNTDEAITLYQEALAIYKGIGDILGKGRTLKMLGQLLADRKKQFTTALDYLQQSLEILQRFQSPEAEKVRQMIAYVQKMADEKQ